MSWYPVSVPTGLSKLGLQVELQVKELADAVGVEHKSGRNNETKQE